MYIRNAMIISCMLFVLNTKTCVNTDKQYGIYVHLGQVEGTYVLSVELATIISIGISFAICVHIGALFMVTEPNGSGPYGDNIHNLSVGFFMIGGISIVCAMILSHVMCKC